MSAPVSKEFARLMSRANSAMVHGRPADSRLTKAERARLARLLSEARKHVQRKRDSKLFEYCGARFRLMTFNGWLIVMAWNGRPLAGPVRIDRRCLTPSTSRGHDSTCLQTTGNGRRGPYDEGGRIRHPGGFFTSTACAAFSMAGRVGKPQGLPVPLSRSANPASARHPFVAEGGGIQTADKGASAMRHTAPGTPAHALPLSHRLSVYRALRLIVGPARAFRLTLGRA